MRKQKKPRISHRDMKESEIIAIERLRADVQQVIYSTMQRKKITRKELARRLACSPANVTQILSESGNPRVETIARIFHALGDEMNVSSQAFDEMRANETLKIHFEILRKTLATWVTHDPEIANHNTKQEETSASWQSHRPLRSGRTASRREHKQGQNCVEEVMLVLENTFEDSHWGSMSTAKNPKSSKKFEYEVEAA